MLLKENNKMATMQNRHKNFKNLRLITNIVMLYLKWKDMISKII